MSSPILHHPILLFRCLLCCILVGNRAFGVYKSVGLN
ncbi:hypothetical protein LOK49_LG01G00436 [Camellia lanceoleosa]|uniref:Uncharacterized protein n=1 Tax=Camellia lanceoleosa TaxID=1840588 RepID=A0ACC0IXW6_9ERIC|nr:hypothetical protein LOK49_LG01G00436 [Camellia lanceoleosa]